MLGNQLIYPLNFAARPGEIGTQIFVVGEGGPQGDPMGSAQPRPYPNSDAAGNPISFGPKLVAPLYGAANWIASRPVNNRISEMGFSGIVDGLIKNPVPLTNF